MIYLIKCNEFIKLGYVKGGTTRAAIGRLKSLQIGNPYKLELVATKEGDLKEEGRLHRRLDSIRSPRVRGEWFSLFGAGLNRFISREGFEDLRGLPTTDRSQVSRRLIYASVMSRTSTALSKRRPPNLPEGFNIHTHCYWRPGQPLDLKKTRKLRRKFKALLDAGIISPRDHDLWVGDVACNQDGQILNQLIKKYA